VVGGHTSTSTLPYLRPGSEEQRHRLKEKFEQGHYVRLPSFFDSELFAQISREIEAARFHPRSHDGIGEETAMEPNALLARLLMMINDHSLFEMVREITGCDRIGCFEGRVYRMLPSKEHYDSWHNDLGDARMVAMTLNLSPGVYAGGLLEMRERSSKEVIAELANTGPGDAILFELAAELQHRVTPVEGSNAKTALAGWFKSSPEFVSALRKGDWSAED
jgi:2OG-Fe(II) oxygenase superfamily